MDAAAPDTEYEYDIYPLPRPLPDADVLSYARVRLLGLQTDPDAFGSTFAREARNTPAVWRARVDTPHRLTLVARARTGAARLGGDTDGAGAGGWEWVGTASVLAPELLRGHAGGPARDEHVLVGMWVHPAHRRKGLGTRLVEAGVAWVRARTAGLPDEERRLTLEVHRPNAAARAMYDGLGFAESVGAECEDKNRVPMFLVAK